MANKTMKTLTINGVTYEIVDEYARINVEELQNLVENKADDEHNHEISEINGLDAALDGKQDNLVFNTAYNGTTNKAATMSDVKVVADLVGSTPVSSQISDAIENKANKTHAHKIDDVDGLQNALDNKDAIGSASSALTSAKSYTDTKIAELINGAPTTLDTLGEIATAMDENADVVAALEESIGKKANISDLTSHTSNQSNPHGVTKSQVGLGNVENKTSATIRGELTKDNVTNALGYIPPTTAAATQSAAGLMSSDDKKTLDTLNVYVGNSSVSSQISTAITNKVDKVSGKGLSTNDYTTTEKNKLSGIASGAEVNQNAFSNIVVGSTTIAADTKTDTLTFVAGSNVTLTPDATNDKITIAATDTVYTHPSYTAKSSGLYKITVNSTGHVSATSTVSKSDITALGIPSQDTTYSEASTSSAGLMSAADKSKLNGIATGANKTTVDTALSSTSTNPVQNKVVNAAISNLNTLVGNTSVSSQISEALSDFNALSIDLTDADTGNANLINADSLGGVVASEYALKADIQNYVDEVILGGAW